MPSDMILRLSDIDDIHPSAQLYRRARSRGVTVPKTADCLIATVCIREQVPLLHADRDFGHLAGVSDLRIVERAA